MRSEMVVSMKDEIIPALITMALCGGVAFWLLYGYEDTTSQRNLCKCEAYVKVRQDCAIAGDFKNCISVKMGSKDYSRCALLAEYGLLSDDMPSATVCWVHRQSKE